MKTPIIITNFTITLAAGLILLIAAVAARADYQSGVSAYQQGDYEQALAQWTKVIESPPETVHPAERAETLYAVAMMFWLGQGVEQDTTVSAGFLRQAAELNHAGAQSKLGYLFLIGQGVPQNNAQAQKWLEMAARQGDPDAQYNLGVVYRDGLGTTADEQLALKWFREAAANGDAYSSQVIAAYEREGVLQQSPEASQVNSVPPPEPAELQADPTPPTEAPDLPASSDQTLIADAENLPTQPATEASINTTLPAQADVDSIAGVELIVTPAQPNAIGDVTLTEDWILLREPEHYTIQVMALKNQDNLTKLMEAHPELMPMAVYLQGKASDPLYVLIQGDYQDIESARAATARFPRTLAKPEHLWIRRFEMVQGLIHSSRANRGNK